MDIFSLLHPQARARRNARGALRVMQVRRGQTEQADRAVVAAAAVVAERTRNRPSS